MITESEQVAQALDDAAKRWPPTGVTGPRYCCACWRRGIGRCSIGASAPITLAEVLVGPARAGRTGQATFVLEQLRVCPVTLPQDAPSRLATFRAATTLTMPDCCVLLAADQVADAIATFDDRLADAARKHGLAVWGR